MTTCMWEGVKMFPLITNDNYFIVNNDQDQQFKYNTGWILRFCLCIFATALCGSYLRDQTYYLKLSKQYPSNCLKISESV